ncbi:hypothetical protein CTA2_6020, partial [Colletotrichum tanaceti]
KTTFDTRSTRIVIPLILLPIFFFGTPLTSPKSRLDTDLRMPPSQLAAHLTVSPFRVNRRRDSSGAVT